VGDTSNMATTRLATAAADASNTNRPQVDEDKTYQQQNDCSDLLTAIALLLQSYAYWTDNVTEALNSTAHGQLSV